MRFCLYFCALADIYTGHGQRFEVEQRRRIRQYQQNYLTVFCHSQGLSTPQFDVDNYGKPFCINIPKLQFNHSHSQNHYALAYSLNVKKIGVDVEDLERQANFLALAKRCFHLNELNYWLECKQNRELWFKIWTAKEAIVKASGIGIRINLNEINTNVRMESLYGEMVHHRLGRFYYQHQIMEQSSVVTVAYQ